MLSALSVLFATLTVKRHRRRLRRSLSASCGAPPQRLRSERKLLVRDGVLMSGKQLSPRRAPERRGMIADEIPDRGGGKFVLRENGCGFTATARLKPRAFPQGSMAALRCLPGNIPP